jgi:peroxiredoxin Q/BCP
VVLGVSPDSPRKHKKFTEKYALPYTLVADEDHAIAESYGVWVQKLFWGRFYWGVARTTFVVDRDGLIAHVFEKVEPENHAVEVADVVTRLRGG